MFRLSVFPAEDGDCLLLTYGDQAPFRHVIVDGGRASTYPLLRERLERIRDDGEEVELLVLSHVDADHIEGVLKLALDPDLPVVPKRVWYNGYDQMEGLQAFSFAQGDKYSACLKELGWPVNADFGGGAVSVEGRPEPFELAGLMITLVSPDIEHLRTLRSKWASWRTSDENTGNKRGHGSVGPTGLKKGQSC